MIRRPLNTRFNVAVERDEKITTIRDRAWPLDVPIMLYNWIGLPYRTKQKERCSVTVVKTCDIVISRFDDAINYVHSMDLPRPLWSCEGFDDQQDMDAWFATKLKVGQSVTKVLHLFTRNQA